MSDELITWLRAQLDDDERAALAWLPLGNPTEADRDHMARLNPTRMLAEVEAKRRIIEAEQDRVIEEGSLPERMRDLIETDVIKLLAQPYAGREGWREEWRLAVPGS